MGNIYASRDWSDSEDFMEAVWLMLNQDTPREYILSSNETHTVKEFLEITCDIAELSYIWENLSDDLNTRLLVNGQVITTIDKNLYRPAEVDILHGDSTETRKLINWEPKVSFKQLVEKMLKYDISTLN